MLELSNLIFINHRNANEKYPLATAKIEKMYTPSELKMERWYGGNLKKVCKLKDSPVVLLATDKETIDIAIDLKSVKPGELKSRAKELEIDIGPLTKEEIIKKVYQN
jgi:hypothetical protein